MKNIIITTKLAMDSVSVFRGILEDKVLKNMRTLLNYICTSNIELDQAINLYNDFFFEFSLTGVESFEVYIIDKIIYNENSFSLRGQNKEAAEKDLDNLQILSKISSSSIKESIKEHFKESEYKYAIENLPEWKNKAESGFRNGIEDKFIKNMHWRNCIGSLGEFYKNNGCGDFARYRAFIWEKINGEGYLKGIAEPDPITLQGLIGYESERSIVIENTLQFLSGYAANNVLLYGDRGTGKSSTVKAILNEYYHRGLRIIEVPKAYLTDFPLILRAIKNRPQRFIIFVDDLVFADNEESYTALKAILEGGLESKTNNTVIYATSNRRHLVKEYFSERAGLQSLNSSEEVHARDSIEEKMSLADRFGINVVFSAPDQQRYLDIVDGIAKMRNIKVDKETLHKEALKWELWYNKRSARTARQFVDWFEGKNA